MMKKHFKKLVSLALSAIMVVGMSITTFAANCSSFAVKVWNSVSSKTLSAGTPNTPTSLMSSIKSKSGYQTGRSIGNTTPIGYVSNGSFVTVTMNKAASISKTNDIAVMDTTVGNAEFITPIDMNPYSYTAN